MIITYALSERELVRIMWKGYLQKSRILIFIACTAGLGPISFWLGFPITSGFVAVLLAWAVAAFVSDRRELVRAVQGESDSTATMTIEIDDVGVRGDMPGEADKVLWSSFKRFREDKNYFYLDGADGDDDLEMIVPKRAFASLSNLDTFRRLANQGMATLERDSA
jgi:hypothetical protein